MVTRGSVCTSSRIWMMMLEMQRAMPAAKRISIIMYIGTHTVASFGARPKTMNRMVSGIQAISVFRPEPHGLQRKALPRELRLCQQRLVVQERVTPIAE